MARARFLRAAGGSGPVARRRRWVRLGRRRDCHGAPRERRPPTGYRNSFPPCETHYPTRRREVRWMGKKRGRRWILFVLTALLIAAAWGSRATAQAVTPAERVEGPVYVIPIEGTIDEGLAAFVERALGEARDGGAVAVLLEINTFGGRVDSATRIKDAVTAMPVPVVAFVTQRAWSAGALIALGARYVAMAPGTSIGAAEPRPADEKTISALRKEFEAAAEARGRDPLVAGAMVDADIEIEGLVEKGQVLTLSAQQ